MKQWLAPMLIAAGAVVLWWWWRQRGAPTTTPADDPARLAGQLTIGNVGHNLIVSQA